VSSDGRFLLRVVIKGLVLFAVLNVLFAAADPMPALGRISIYNRLVPGRVRLPFGSQPELSYNLSLNNLDAMFAAHEIAAAKPADEYRVVVLGDSSTWGFLLGPEETRTALLNSFRMEHEGRRVRFYNLGYPTISLTKDLMLLRFALRHQPDLIVWITTLEAMPADKQLSSPLLQNNPEEVRGLIAEYGLPLDPQDPALPGRSFWDRTIVGRRRDLADLLRLQAYGFSWAATGVDIYIPDAYDPPVSDLPADDSFHALTPPALGEGDLAWEVLEAGRAAAGDVPVLVVNEPIYVSRGANHEVRYNVFYPRWAYDEYRRQMPDHAGNYYLDLWDLVPADQFSNSAIHLTPAGERMTAEQIERRIRALLDGTNGLP
jgi:hypothetical protein